jgi:hypothetical protein
VQTYLAPLHIIKKWEALEIQHLLPHLDMEQYAQMPGEVIHKHIQARLYRLEYKMKLFTKCFKNDIIKINVRKVIYVNH